jgi:hypothetical protein
MLVPGLDVQVIVTTCHQQSKLLQLATAACWKKDREKTTDQTMPLLELHCRLGSAVVAAHQSIKLQQIF